MRVVTGLRGGAWLLSCRRPSLLPSQNNRPAQLRTHDDGRLASEEMFAKLELAGFTVGKRFAER